MKKFPYKTTLKRYGFLQIVITLIVCAIVVKAAHTMFVNNTFWENLAKLRVREGVPITPIRGNILSADGEILATSLPEYRIILDFEAPERDSVLQRQKDSVFISNLDSLSIQLNEVAPDKTVKWFKDRLLKGFMARTEKGGRLRYWIVYPGRVSYVDYKKVLKMPFLREKKFRSIGNGEPNTEICKPFGSLATRTLGDMYKGKDSARSGLQYKYDSLLRGTPGVVHRQKIRNRYLDIVDVPAINGADIVTTIDVKMQDFAEKTLREQMTHDNALIGVALLMEVATGDVKAIVNLTRRSEGVYVEDRNTAVSNLMEPGSVFKPMSFLVAFDDGKLNLNQTVECCGGRKMMYGLMMTDHNAHKGGYGTLTVSQCLENSSNIGVSTLIDKIYHERPEDFVSGIYRTGVGEDLDLEIPGYAVPKIPRPKRGPKGKLVGWHPADIAWMSIGYRTQIPPISVINFYNGIANGGRMMKPRFVTCAMRDGKVIQEFPPMVIREQMASPGAIKTLQKCLFNVVNEKTGTGKRAKSKYFTSAGKTGTAQVWEKAGKTSKKYVSFVGYFPTEAPKYSCMVSMVINGNAGGAMSCAPVFRKISEMAMSNSQKPKWENASDTLHNHLPVVCSGNMAYANNVLSDLSCMHQTDWRENNMFSAWGRSVIARNEVLLKGMPLNTEVVPDLTDMGARDAVYLLEQMGMKVQLEGYGVVQQQSLPYGHIIKKGEKILLRLGLRGYKVEAFEEEEIEDVADTIKHNASDTSKINAGVKKQESESQSPAKGKGDTIVNRKVNTSSKKNVRAS